MSESIQTGALDTSISDAMRELDCSGEARLILEALIQKAVLAYYKLEYDQLVSATRAQLVCWPRMMGMYLTRQYVNAPLVRIAALYGRTDHNTAINAIRVVTNELSISPGRHHEFKELVAIIDRAVLKLALASENK